MRGELDLPEVPQVRKGEYQDREGANYQHLCPIPQAS